jgi:hypothetical protein
MPKCKARLLYAGEATQPLGLGGVVTVVYYECTDCAWSIERRYFLSPMN